MFTLKPANITSIQHLSFVVCSLWSVKLRTRTRADACVRTRVRCGIRLADVLLFIICLNEHLVCFFPNTETQVFCSNKAGVGGGTRMLPAQEGVLQLLWLVRSPCESRGRPPVGQPRSAVAYPLAGRLGWAGQSKAAFST